MKKTLIILVVFIGIVVIGISCKKDNAAQKECENEGGYWENGKCIKIPPITMKDTVIFVNFQGTTGASELGLAVPERSVLDLLKKSGYNVSCKFYRRQNHDQNAPSVQSGPPIFVMEESMDSIVALYNAGLITWVEGDTVLVSGNPTATFVEKGKKVKEPITVMSKSAYEAGKPGSKSVYSNLLF